MEKKNICTEKLHSNICTAFKARLRAWFPDFEIADSIDEKYQVKKKKIAKMF